MNKRPEKNDDQSSVDIPLCDRIATEIATITKTAAKESLAAFESATANIEKLRGISQEYASQLEEKKARLETERSATGINIDIIESLQRRRNLEREIAEVELSMKEFDTEFWPVAVKAEDDARKKITEHLAPIISEMKQDYQAQLDALFLESIAIMEAFRDAVYHISHKPEFSDLGGSRAATLTSFDLNKVVFNQMNKLNMGFGIIMPKEIDNKPYQVVVYRKEQ